MLSRTAQSGVANADSSSARPRFGTPIRTSQYGKFPFHSIIVRIGNLKSAHCVIVTAALLLAGSVLPTFAQVEGERISVSSAHPVAAIQDTETPAQRDARMAWWREARFGMFIHWGLYSVPAGT